MRILDGGLVTTVQDTGRYGHYHIGMPPSGAMDQFAHTVANWLVGNDDSEATLEMTYVGADVEFEDDAVFAVTGADMDPSLEDEPVPTWTAVRAEAGDTLSFEFAKEGTRSYIAVAGGIDVEPVMESRSTYTLIGIGGHEGRSLENGDELPIGEPAADADATVGTSIDEENRPDYSTTEINVVMGLCDYRLTDEGRRRFLDADWTISDEADRVGYRFEGPDITDMFEEREQPFGAGPDVTNVVDLGYPVGSIQMAGQPIILMRDAVTGGGYVTIGTVVSPERDALAQCRTHDTVDFNAVGAEEALEIGRERDDLLEEIRRSL
ncbi:urea amidolyase-like protein [Natronococcus amylolyticus DSM 10524]|uniref:Urea amidolyase-like protein n=1 Tax=Natronococcus amylolyticus DSM 10524 TaxID=1227497 RepID=L9X6R1_9EURY|nr:biotin-dependent carboxyltransferase family protein [Natronococcus amylolyticus]ELY57126.1 urea amidolyase-like protein [Natronococcus amylolyticus DSM 10524]